MAQIGFIGLGRMGYAMSRNLVEAGQDVSVFDIDATPIERVATIGD